MKNKILLLAIVAFCTTPFSASAFSLGQSTLQYNHSSGAKLFEELLFHSQRVFDNYDPEASANYVLQSPLVVAGTEEQPELFFKLKSCVSVFCMVSSFYQDITVKTQQGNCDKNYQMTAVIRKDPLSAASVTLSYSQVTTDICLVENGPSVKVDFDSSLHTVPGASAETKYKAFFETQIKPLTEAWVATLKQNGATF